MDRLFLPQVTLTLFLLVFSLTVFSQHAETDTLILSKAVAKAKTIYTNSIASNSHLLNGTQYKETIIHNYDIGYPYFLTDDWIDSASIDYDGQVYQNISLMYDIVRDKIILDHPFSHFSIQLINEKIKSFKLTSHTFVFLKEDSSQTATIRAGFYDLLYNGTVKLYARRKKEINSIVEAPLVKTEFVDKNQFFVYKNGNYFPVKTRSSILKLFSDRKSPLRKYIKKEKLNFHKDRDVALTKSVKFYDESER